MTNLFPTYRVLALIVGVLLAFCSLVALPAKYFATEGSDLQQFGESASIMWVFHGWIFMVYFVVAFLLARRVRLECRLHDPDAGRGLIPLLIFWVERRVTARVRARPDGWQRPSVTDRLRAGRRWRARRGRGGHAPRPVRAPA